MNIYHRFFLISLLAVITFTNTNAQNKDSLHKRKIVISTIKISGNSITKSSIILRELTFKKGDTINTSDWTEDTIRSKYNILNTSLFNFVYFSSDSHPDGGVDVTITVVERWYIVPIPIFQLEERNFNTWWEQDHRSLSKVDYGLFFSDNNTRGRKEILRLKLQLGYTQQWGLTYDVPYITHNQDFGLQFNFTSSQNKEVAYTSIGNILTFLSTPNKILQQQYTSAIDLTYRQGLYNTHYLELNFAACYINDTILKLTHDYLPYNLTHAAFFGGKYYFKRDLRDHAAYPLEGYFFDCSINDYGFGLALPDQHAFNITYLQASIHKYWKITDQFYYAFEAEGKVSENETQPYYLQRALGYANDFVRGYEYYVIDGNNYALIKNEMKFQLINIPLINLPTQRVPLLKGPQFNKAYFASYLTLFSDWGYVDAADPNTQNNFLANTPLWGYGVGIDMVFYYDAVIRFEYSFNQLNQKGFFLHFLADM